MKRLCRWYKCWWCKIFCRLKAKGKGAKASWARRHVYWENVARLREDLPTMAPFRLSIHVWIDPPRDFRCMKTNTTTFFLNIWIYIFKKTNKQTNKQASKQASKQSRQSRQARQGKARQGKARPGQARQGKARQGQARQGKARQGKARQGKEASKQASKQTVTALVTHSQFRHAYAETCMVWSLRQAYDYREGQPCLFYMQAHFGIIRPARSVANIWYSTTCPDLPHSCPSVDRFAQVKTLEYYAWPVPGVSGNGATALNMYTGIYSKSSTPAKCNWLLKLINPLTWHAWIPVPKVQNDIMLKSSVRNAWAVWISIQDVPREHSSLFKVLQLCSLYFPDFPGTHHTIYMHPNRNPPNPPGSHKEKLGHLALNMGHPWGTQNGCCLLEKTWNLRWSSVSKPLTFESKPENLCPPVAGTEMPSRRKKLPQTVYKWVWRAGIFPPAHKLDTFLAVKQCAKHSATVSIRQDIVLPCASVRVETALTYLTYESTPWANRCRLSETTAKPSPDSRSACWPAVAERT